MQITEVVSRVKLQCSIAVIGSMKGWAAIPENVVASPLKPEERPQALIFRWCILSVAGALTGVEDGSRSQAWGKNGANRTPIYAIQCHLCIYATYCGRVSQPVTTGLSLEILHIPLHNWRVTK